MHSSEIRVTMGLPMKLKIYKSSKVENILAERTSEDFQIENSRVNTFTKGEVLVEQIEYDEGKSFYASMGKGGTILTTSQLARYIQDRHGLGDFRLIGWVKGNKRLGLKGVYGSIRLGKLEIRDNHWRLIPQNMNLGSVSTKMEKEFSYELKAYREMEGHLRNAIKLGDVNLEHELRDDMLDIRGMFDEARRLYGDDIDMVKTSRKKHKSKKGFFPYFRNVFPITARHVYHNPNNFLPFNIKGKIIEKGGVIGSKKDDFKSKEENEMDNIYDTLKKENDKKEINNNDILSGLIKNQVEHQEKSSFDFLNVKRR